MRLSILVATLESRRELFASVGGALRAQIRRLGLEDEVELLAERDHGEEPVGRKRNRLVARARGEFVCFVDDDDEVSDRYVELLHEAVRATPSVDCVGITGTITFRGRSPRPFVHSLRYREYSSANGVYRRPPYHLNPIRRSIALRHPFLEVDRGEDVEWALRLARAGALRRERFLDEPVYRYRSRRLYAYQWALDRTERLRHPLGLTRASLLRMRRPPEASARGGAS